MIDNHNSLRCLRCIQSPSGVCDMHRIQKEIVSEIGWVGEFNERDKFIPIGGRNYGMAFTVWRDEWQSNPAYRAAVGSEIRFAKSRFLDRLLGSFWNGHSYSIRFDEEIRENFLSWNYEIVVTATVYPVPNPPEVFVVKEVVKEIQTQPKTFIGRIWQRWLDESGKDDFNDWWNFKR